MNSLIPVVFLKSEHYQSWIISQYSTPKINTATLEEQLYTMLVS